MRIARALRTVRFALALPVGRRHETMCAYTGAFGTLLLQPDGHPALPRSAVRSPARPDGRHGSGGAGAVPGPRRRRPCRGLGDGPREGGAHASTRPPAIAATGRARNADLSGQRLRKHARLDPQSLALVERAMLRLGLTGRGFDRIRRVARTIADLDDSPTIRRSHVAEAIQYRVIH